MKRLAFLIGGTYRASANRLSSVEEDIRAWRKFLTSPCGGSWTNGEIIDLSGKARNVIATEIRRGGDADYSLVCFSGRGRLVKDRFGFSTTKLFVNDRDEMMEDECNPGSPWCTMVFDCSLKRLAKEKAALSGKMPGVSFPEDARVRFEEELLKCETGLVVACFADAGGTTANKRSFSQALLSVVRKRESYSDGVLRIDQAVRLAGNAMPKRHAPVYEGGRRVRHFPFALLPKDRPSARNSI